MISIGNDVCISKGITMLTHDYSAFVFRKITGEVLGYADTIKIGNNIQIGADVTILPGTIIEDNVIIGSRSLLKGTYKSGFVYAGIPAKTICSLDDFVQKREELQTTLASKLVFEFYKKKGRFPSESELDSYHFFPIWSDCCNWPENFWNGFGQKNSKNTILNYYKEKKSKYKNYQEFCDELLNNSK